MSFHVSVHSESTPGNEPSFLPGNLAGMQHAGLSVFVNFLALEPGTEKGKSQKPGKTKAKNTPRKFFSLEDQWIRQHYSRLRQLD